jgi:probable F420-dependent oxidoreductase
MADVPRRYGVTVPIPGVPLHAHREWFEEIAALGFTDVWSSEADGPDGFTPLALATAWVPTLRGGIAIVPAFTRGPALLAQSAATMADAAPGRFALGIGASSPAIVERWNGIPFVDPFRRTRDTVRFLRRALTGEKVAERYDTFEVQGFRLGLVPEIPPTILVAALRPRMLTLAGDEGDGAIVNWLSASDVAQVAPYVNGKEIVARIFVAPTDDFDVVRTMAARAITSYLNVDVYAKFHEWLGRASVLQPMWDAWAAGDRARALELVPDEVIDDLIVWGTPEQIRAKVEDYAANGVTTTAPSIMGRGDAVRDTIRALAPTATP